MFYCIHWWDINKRYLLTYLLAYLDIDIANIKVCKKAKIIDTIKYHPDPWHHMG